MSINFGIDKLRLLVDATPVRSGGGVQVASSLLINLIERGAASWHAIIAEDTVPQFPAEIIKHKNVTVLPVSRGFMRFMQGWKFRKIEHEFNPDVVFTVFGPQMFKSRRAHLVGFAMVHLLYEREGLNRFQSLWRLASDFLIARQFRKADHIVVETETAKVRLCLLLGISEDRVSVVRNTYSVSIQDDYAVNPISEDFVILIPSAYYKHKQLELVPEIACNLRQKISHDRFVIHFTLDPASLEWRNIERKADSLGVSRNIVNLGILRGARLGAAYRDANLVLLPTLREVSSAVYPEAFFSKRPLVTSDMDFARELCGEAAMYAEPKSAESYASCIHELVRNDVLYQNKIEQGLRRLDDYYLSPLEKFDRQMSLLKKVSVSH